MKPDRFETKKDFDQFSEMLEGWTNDPENIKAGFVELAGFVLEKADVSISFLARPGVSYSMRVGQKGPVNKGRRPLFLIVDIVEEAGDNRWLSICFYEDMISDPDEEGELVPKGLLGEDGYCFNLFDYNESLISYIVQRINEAHGSALTL